MGMLHLPTVTSLPVERLLTVLPMQSPLLVALNLVAVPTRQVALRHGVGLAQLGCCVATRTLWLWSITPKCKGEGMGQEGLAGIRQGWVGREGSPPAPIPQRLFVQGGPGQTSRAGLSPALTGFSRDVQRLRRLFVIHMDIPCTQPRSSLVPGEQQETSIHKHPLARSRVLIPCLLDWMRPRAVGLVQGAESSFVVGTGVQEPLLKGVRSAVKGFSSVLRLRSRC